MWLKILSQSFYLINIYLEVLSCPVIFLQEIRKILFIKPKYSDFFFFYSEVLYLIMMTLNDDVYSIRSTNLNINIKYQFNIDYFSIHVILKVVLASFL